jgi:hypothetical protein
VPVSEVQAPPPSTSASRRVAVPSGLQSRLVREGSRQSANVQSGSRREPTPCRSLTSARRGCHRRGGTQRPRVRPAWASIARAKPAQLALRACLAQPPCRPHARGSRSVGRGGRECSHQLDGAGSGAPTSQSGRMARFGADVGWATAPSLVRSVGSSPLRPGR